MADLIERGALLKDMGLTDAVKYGNKDSEQQTRSYSTWMSYEIADAIQDAPAVNRWIPCSERLPEYGVDVLVYAKPWEDHIQVAHIQYDGIMWEMSDGEFYFSKSDVTHWMPLPEPPEVMQDD